LTFPDKRRWLIHVSKRSDMKRSTTRDNKVYKYVTKKM
jgi:hypothetical protein